MLAADVALGHEIAQLLAGTGRPLSAEEIALELGHTPTEVHDVLLRDNRFEPRSVWVLLREPEDDTARERKPASAIRAGSTPAPRAAARSSEATRIESLLGLVDQHSVDWRNLYAGGGQPDERRAA